LKSVAPTSRELRETYERKRVLLTGHTGFKGTWLTLWLHDLGAEVTGYALPPATTPSAFTEIGGAGLCRSIEGDVRDPGHLGEVVRQLRPEVVFHLAAQPIVRLSYELPAETIATNVQGTANVLDALRLAREPCAVVVVTSDKCYENREWLHGYREPDRLGGHDVYSMSKAAAELVVASYRKSFFAKDDRIRLSTARAGNVIGGGDWSPDRLVVDAIRSLTKAAPIEVRNPDSTRPWQHVVEPLAGYLALGARLLQSDGGRYAEPWNFGPPSYPLRSVRDVVEELLRAWGSGSWKQTGTPGAHEAHTLRLNVDKAASALGWRPRWRFEEAVRRTVDWYRAHHQGAGADSLRSLMRTQVSEYLEASPLDL
jgi:CDP-glucose 4,6-dehydratase